MANMSTRKRKREARTGAGDEGDDAMAALKRHFETQFAPLKQHARAKGKGKGKGNGEKMAKAEECEWAGIPDEDEEEEEEREAEGIADNSPPPRTTERES